jgi:hypothetical protein
MDDHMRILQRFVQWKVYSYGNAAQSPRSTLKQKWYITHMNKQMNLPFLHDELAQVRTKKKEFLAQIGRSGSGSSSLTAGFGSESFRKNIHPQLKP